jgi:hypothetical protein
MIDKNKLKKKKKKKKPLDENSSFIEFWLWT